MGPNISPCKGCEERYPGCHDHCEKYAKWKAEVQKINTAEREYKRKCREDFLMSEQCESSKNKWRCGKSYGRE